MDFIWAFVGRVGGSAGMGFGAFVSKASIAYIRFAQPLEGGNWGGSFEELRLAPATVFTDLGREESGGVIPVEW
ncbi:hypothetical protein [Pseudobacter ginsenosidimutans]|uniref:hypothetical protein n=1 Tax=Pseudobacter ginsenosidimutans TaxID=661488 RepID=UPI00102DBFD5|nr:hypothetical protein [Pseudobacter ginsenosidimutans]